MINDIIKSFLNQANANGSKTNVIKPLLSLIVFFLAALITSSNYCPSWITIVLAIVMFALSIFFIFVFWYCLMKQPDLLRSEKFNLDKMVVEHTRYNQTKDTLPFDIENIVKETPDNERIPSKADSVEMIDSDERGDK